MVVYGILFGGMHPKNPLWLESVLRGKPSTY